MQQGHRDIPSDLYSSINAVYTEFRKYKLHDRIEGCPCCVGPQEDSQLRSKPLRILSNEDLSRYYFKAMTTWGTIEDFKHFLPRILELLSIEGSSLGFDDEILGSKLKHARLNTWSESEQSAVGAFFEAWLLSRIAKFPSIEPAEPCLCAIALSGVDISKYLLLWEACNSPEAVCQFIHMVRNDWSGLAKRRRLGPYWHDTESNHNMVIDWMLSKAWCDRIEAMALANTHEPWSDAAMETVDWIRAII